MATPTQRTLTFHHIPPVSAFDLTATQPDLSPNLVLWIGGLFDVLGSVAYPFQLANSLPDGWSLFQLILSSSGKSWGVSSLDKDVAEIAGVVSHFRKDSPNRKIVLMGHSTGCQDSIHYVSSSASEPFPAVDGIILQAPVSDREALSILLDEEALQRANSTAQTFVEEGRGDDCLPSSIVKPAFGEIGLTASRWLSLSSPDGKGKDDYFSSDLPDSRLQSTFGAIPSRTSLLSIYSGADEYRPAHVDVPAMLRRWKRFAEAAGVRVSPDSTTLLDGATHNLNGVDQAVVDELRRRVCSFLETLEQGTEA